MRQAEAAILPRVDSPESRVRLVFRDSVTPGSCQKGHGARTAWLRFYGELNDHLPPEARQRVARIQFDVPPTVKGAIEAFGIPHVEVALVTCAGEPLGFSDRIAANDRIAVYPLFGTLDISECGSVGIVPPRPIRFIADFHLHKLCHLLRLLGIDTEIRSRDTDPVAASAMHRRILLSRDRRLLRRRGLEFGYWVRSVNPVAQVAEVIRRYDLAAQLRPLERCSVCNGLLFSVEKESVVGELPPRTAAWLDTYMRCNRCGKLYWKGTHVDRIARLLGEFVDLPLEESCCHREPDRIDYEDSQICEKSEKKDILEHRDP